MTVRGVVFDLDGTLIDGYSGIAAALNAARSAFGLPALALDEVRARVGHGLPQLMIDVVGASRAAEGVEIFRRVYDRICEDETGLMPDVATTLAALEARGIRMSVASNKPALFSNRILGHLGVRAHFDAVEGPDTAGTAKPDPSMIHACVAAMGIPAEAAVYVGDMTLDAEAGARAGVPVILVAGGSSPVASLQATGCPVLPVLRDLLLHLPA